MASLTGTVLGILWEVIDRANTLSQDSRAQLDGLHHFLNTLAQIRSLLSDQEEAGLQYTEQYLEIIQELAERCNEGVLIIEAHNGKHWVTQYLRSKQVSMDLERITQSLHATLELLQNVVTDSIFSLVSEYHQTLLSDPSSSTRLVESLSLLEAPPRDFGTLSAPQAPPRELTVESQRYLKALRRSSRMLGTMLEEQAVALSSRERSRAALVDSRGVSVEAASREELENELSSVQSRLSVLETSLGTASASGSVDVNGINEMVSLQCRALDLMKQLYAEEEAALLKKKAMGELQAGNAVGQEGDIRFIKAAVIGAKTVGEGRSRFTEYQIEVTRTGEETWRLGHRYSDFYALDLKLRRIALANTSVTEGALPSLPPKVYSNMTEECVNSRLNGLHEYLTRVVSHPELGCSESLASFLRPNNTTTPSGTSKNG